MDQGHALVGSPYCGKLFADDPPQTGNRGYGRGLVLLFAEEQELEAKIAHLKAELKQAQREKRRYDFYMKPEKPFFIGAGTGAGLMLLVLAAMAIIIWLHTH
jgi:hypothetical protein